MEFNKCKICKRYHYDTESCGDLYKIYHEEYLGDSFKEIYGNSFQDVCEEYAQYYNSDNELFYESIIIEVEDKDGLRKKFELSAEHTVYYNVDEI